MPKKKILLLLVVLSFGSILAGFLTVPERNYLLVMHSLSVGFVGSSIFYFFVVYIPERQKRKRVRTRLEKQYKSIKLDCIHLFLIVSNSQDFKNRELLLNLKEFRCFFNEGISSDMTRWDAVANGLQGYEYGLNELLYFLRLLNEEIRHAMTTVDIHDEEVNAYLKHCSQVLSRMDMVQPDYDDIKLLCRNLWGLFTGFAFTNGGYKETDVIQEMINRI